MANLRDSRFEPPRPRLQAAHRSLVRKCALAPESHRSFARFCQLNQKARCHRLCARPSSAMRAAMDRHVSSLAKTGVHEYIPRFIWKMKAGIHPEYYETDIVCACGAVYHTRSTRRDIKIGICAACHPFFTGEQKFA